MTTRPPPDTVWDLIRDGNPEHEHPDPALGGWAPPDARISFIGEGGSKFVEIIPEGRVFHAPLPEGVQAVPDRTANAMVGVINRLKSALVRARSALSCRSPRSTQTETGRAGADDAGPSGFGGRGPEERERERHSPLRHRRSDVGTSTSGERSGPERGRRSLSVAREPSPELQPQPQHWGGFVQFGLFIDKDGAVLELENGGGGGGGRGGVEQGRSCIDHKSLKQSGDLFSELFI
ncbi:uncharacterized protein [Spinacia oleracea]|uniref:Uncharacterized protein n=1 Tax=Spinacia oleracea TaxID=3562 RepID=A0ABM3QYA7_SPIOL|nr:uncharacterized protein LOC130463275 [Spinacia oleracea]